MGNRRVVITSVGAVSPLGLKSTDLWAGLMEGRCGIGRIQSFDPVKLPCQIAGEVPEYKIRDYVPKNYRKATKLMCRDIELSVIAADEAVRGSGLISKAVDPEGVTLRPERTAIDFGSGIISCELPEIAPSVAISAVDGQFDMKKWGSEGLETVTPLWLLKYLPNMLPCHVGILHDIQGPSNTITCGEVSSHIAVTEAAEMILRDSADVALAGGGEAKVNPLLMVRQCLLKRSVFTGNDDDPTSACRPFDAAAAGAAFGEGAGVLVLEEYGHARGRGAKILAEFVGGASSCTAMEAYVHMKDGQGLKIAIEQALAQAQITAADLDLIIPHGTGIARDDRVEAQVLQEVLGDAVGEAVVWPIKGQVSHTGAAAGAIDLIAAVGAMEHGKIGAAYNFRTPVDGCKLCIPTEPIEKEIRHVLCCGYSYGGQTAAVVLKKVSEGSE